MTDYNREYARCVAACGEPFQEFVDFFTAAESARTVLDLGCGQGRDALMAARLGHTVHGVDAAETGIAQMVSAAKQEGLAVTGETQDIRRFETTETFDVVVLDRVLHMLARDEWRTEVLESAISWVRPAGHILVADTKRNRAQIRDFFSTRGWIPVLRRKDFCFSQRPASE